MNGQTVDAVIFDAGGVLVDFYRQDYFKRMGYSDEMADQLTAATFGSEDWKELDRGVLTREELLRRFISRAPRLEAEIRDAFRDLKGTIARRPAAITWMQSVKSRGRRVYILSNISEGTLTDCAQEMDCQYYADGCFWSYEHRLIKPDIAIYLTMLYEYQIDPARAVFIDDTRRNLDAAARLGIRTILYQSQEQAERELDHLLLL